MDPAELAYVVSCNLDGTVYHGLAFNERPL